MTIDAVYRSEADTLELGIGDAEPVAVVHDRERPLAAARTALDAPDRPVRVDDHGA